jgi:hypothetical protein
MSVARKYHQQMVHFLRKTITYSNDGADASAQVVIGRIPSGSLILKPASGVHVVTAFNAATTNVVHIGTPGNSDLFGTSLALGTTTFVPLDEAIGGFRVSADMTVVAWVTLTGTAATTGEAEVVICYIPDSDG